jgi:hypothetical protein
VKVITMVAPWSLPADSAEITPPWAVTSALQIATSRPWTQMVPDQSLFSSGVSSERTLNTAMRTLDPTCAMLYLSSQCHIRVNVDRILTRRVKATLVNPATGDEKDAGTYETGNAAGAVFPPWVGECFSVPGYWEDAVLILDGCE